MSRLVVRALFVLLAAVGWLAWWGSALGSSGLGSSGWAPSPAAASWTWPVGGSDAVTRAFAPPAHRYGAGHRGVDLLALPGSSVRAAGPGRVSYSGLLAGRGVVVVVHGHLRTTYEPVTATVGLGQRVRAGEVLGQLQPGHAGCPAPACLHWGLRRGEDYLDPTRLVGRGPVRLLPLSAGGGPVGSGPAPDRPPGTGPRWAGPPLPRVAGSAAPAASSSGSAVTDLLSRPAGVSARVPPVPAAVAALALAASSTALSLRRSRR